MITIIEAFSNDYKAIQDIAFQTWPLTYGEILSKEQLDFMLNSFYTESALRDSIEMKQHHYLVAMENEICLGFVSFEHNVAEQNKTKIHKIYILPETQGRGIGKKLLNVVIEKATNQKEKTLILNVNRFNKALHFYKKMGFEIIAEEDIEIGNGYLMEDFVLEKSL